MIIFLNTRLYSLQRRYLVAAFNGEKKDKIWIDIGRKFIHCDHQNVPSSIFLLFPWLITFIKPRIIMFVIKNCQKIVKSIINEEDYIIIDQYIISTDCIVSHLAKRLKSSNRQHLASYRLSLVLLLYDQLIFNRELQALRKRFNPETDTVVLFNGRVSPEGLIRHLWTGEIRYVEQGFQQKFYYDAELPVSKLRWDNEFKQIGSSNTTQRKCPKPNSIILFLTSPYEYIFAHGFKPIHGLYQNQYDILKSYVAICRELNLNPLVKFHPANPKENFLLDHNKEAFSFEFDETVDNALNLIAASDLVVLSSSSLAIDSAILGKPSCHCLPAFYEKASISIPTKDKSALREFIKNPLLIHGAQKRGLLLQNGFAASAFQEDGHRSLNRYVKRAVLGH